MLTKINPSVLLVSLSTFLINGVALTSNARADSFNDAVNLYLKGFEYCTEADDYYQKRNLSSASEALGRYKKQKARAVEIDPSILKTSQREMDSNIRYCQRVETALEIALGEPLLSKAIEQCDLAHEALASNQMDSALSTMSLFHSLSQEALQAYPSLNDVYSARSNVSRCNRLSDKIRSASAQQEANAELIINAESSFEQWSNLCSESLRITSLGSQEKTYEQLEQSHAKNRHIKNQLDALPEQTKATPIYSKAINHFISGEHCLKNLELTIQKQKAELARIATQQQKELKRKNLIQSNLATNPQSKPVSKTINPSLEPSPVPVKNNRPPVPPLNDLNGSLTFSSTPPEFGVLYFNRSLASTRIDPINVTIKPSGFNQVLYTVQQNGAFILISDDFAFHRINLTIPELSIKKNLAWLQTRQKKTIHIDWPENTLARIESDRTGIPPAYIAHIPTTDYRVLELNQANPAFTISRENRKQSGYLLIPGYNPIFLSGLDTNNGQFELDLVRDEKIQGKLMFK